ncbi:glycoside hydrolase family 16 protein [Pararhodonellum marinum]|uniref:glycoside hydrolase family 16 protein n=1 Tax=Pararhodonellum marinum TaxID=2755358 RepID=UPI00188FD721|nr:glycoside hydrolase family 16 protein [Pararhodonellum marinum]
MSSKILVLLFSLIVFISSSQAQQEKLVWSDEFDYEGLPDPDKWTYDVGGHGWGNNELQYYTKERPANARVENGTLIITAIREDHENMAYTSSRLLTRGKGSWQYGYFEIKARLPKGLGTWPAIWMLPEENQFGGWPKSGEIDIMEHVGYDPGVVHGTVHTESFNHKIGTQVGKQKEVEDFAAAFNVYAVDWNETKIDFYINGEKYHTFENTGGGPADWPFDHPFHLILNIAVGGDWGGAQGVDDSIWPQEMVVEYVRVYSEKPN